MPPKIRVLIVDDSVVVRRLLVDALGEHPDLLVVGTAPNGQIALAKLESTPADLVTLDVEMPVMDGLETLAAIRRRFPRLPVIMFSSQTRRAAAATIEALTLGANDYVAKPEGAGGVASARARIHEELVPKIRALCRQAAPVVEDVVLGTLSGARARPVTAIAIGVSTGGPLALARILSALPADLPVPVFIVQHMPPKFITLLAARLAQTCRLPVIEVKEPTRALAGSVYLAPGDAHLTVDARAGGPMLGLDRGPLENSCRPAVDVLFRSVAATYGDGALAIVLTGMGNDGVRGCDYVRARGGHVIVQDQASSVVWGMPGSVVRAGLANQIVSIGDICSVTLPRLTRMSG